VALTVRLNPKTERLLNALAKRRKQTRSDVVREAIEQLGAAEEPATASQTVSDQWSDVIGSVRLGARDPHKTTGESFTELARQKARARRSR
jgi:Arc/MetJ-type ribon-helix-helix transcriptional regulator